MKIMKASKSVNTLIDVIVPLCIFFASQIMCSIVYIAISFATGAIDKDNWNPNASDFMSQFAGVVSPALAIASVVTIILILVWKRIRHQVIVGELATLRTSFPRVLLLIFGVFLGIYATNVVSEIIDLPNLAEDLFNSMSLTVMGFISIGILGPIAEEYVFRSAMLGGMLKNGVGQWTAILISSAVFGIIHGNPAQIPFAIIVGILLGLLYVRTGNIIPCIVCHVINNSFSVYLMSKYVDQPDITIADLMGVDTLLPIMLAVVAAGGCYVIFRNKQYNM